MKNDTAILGQERFRSMASTYFRVANGVIVAFDVTSVESYEAVHVWVRQIRDSAPENVRIVLVGNKIDLEDQRRITKEQGQKLAEKLNLDEYLETSAKSGVGVLETFDTLIDYMMGLKKTQQDIENERNNAKSIETIAPESSKSQPEAIAQPKPQQLVPTSNPDAVDINKKPTKSVDQQNKCNC